MLKGLDALLSPGLLHLLAEMGHGDELVLVDRNFPAVSCSRHLVRLDGATLPQAARAILSLLPIDTFIPEPVSAMQMVDTPEVVPEVQSEVFALIEAAEGRTVGVQRLDRHEFYRRATSAFAVLVTGEPRPYGCVLLTKGVL